MKTPWAALAVLAWLAALCGATSGYLLSRHVFERGVAYEAYAPAAPRMADVDEWPYAVNTRLEMEVDADALDRTLGLVAQAGFRWIRQLFLWSQLEPAAKGHFWDDEAGRSSWEKYDRIVQSAARHGLQIIARLEAPPEWSRPSGTYVTHPPANLADYGDFVAAFVARYRGRVKHIQIWNEPNLNHEWGRTPVDPAAYAAMLKLAYHRAKEVDAGVRVIAAGLAPTREPGGAGAQGLDDLVYLQRLYDHGIRAHFDIMGAMAYGLWSDADDRRIGPRWTNFPRVVLQRNVMDRNGDVAVPIWVMEFGWNALPAGWSGRPSPWGTVPESTQAAWTARAYERARVEWPWLGVLSLWVFRIPVAAADDPTPYFSLVRDDFTPRPVYEAVRALANKPLLAGPGAHEQSNPALRFEGIWQFTPDPEARSGALRESPVSGATLRVRFRGTGIDVIAPRGPTRGIANVRINGVYSLADRLPLNRNGQAHIDFFRPLPEPQARISVADGLPDREHELELTVSGERNPASSGPGIGVDALVISRAPPRAPLLLLLAASMGGLAATLWALRPHITPPLTRLVDSVRRMAAVWPDDIGVNPAAVVAVLGAGLLLLPVEPLGWAALGMLAIAAATWPRTALAVAAASAPYYLIQRRLGPLSLPIHEVLLLVVLSVAVVEVYVGRWRLEAPARFAWPAGLFALSGGLSLLASEYTRVSLRELRTVVVEPLLLAALLLAVLRNKRDVMRTVDALVLAGLGVAALALAQVATGQHLVEAEGVQRAAGVYRSPNHLALFLGRVLPLALCVALYSAAGRRRTLHRWACLLLAVALANTFSRGAWFGVAAASAFAAWPAIRAVAPGARRRLALAVGATLPLVGLLAAALVPIDRIRSLVSPTTGTGQLRLRLWQSALAMVRDHPLLGVGLDNFLYLYPRYMHPEAWREPGLSHPHNIVLDYWTRLGIMGIASLAWLLAAFVSVTREAQRTLTDPELRAVSLGLAASMVDFAVHGLVDNSYFLPDLAIVFWTTLALAELCRRLAIEPVRR